MGFLSFWKEMHAKWLQQYGWEEGKGLGRNENGIKESIKVARKSNTNGLGAKGAQWGNDWWDRLYSGALNNMNASKEPEKKPKELKTASAPLLFGSFAKASTLSTLGKEEIDSDKEEESSSSSDEGEEPEETLRKQKSTHHMPDEDVFAACNGMIMRKYIPKGKLERLAEQDKKYMESRQTGVKRATSEQMLSNPPEKKSKSSKKSKSHSKKKSKEEKRSKRKKEKKS